MEQEKRGILLANIGTPEQPEPKAVKAYLKRFLGDKRVIDLPRYQWLPILHGIILQTRPKKSAALYQKIWRKEGSPLLIYTQEQARLLAKKFPNEQVLFGMAYSQPEIKEALLAFHKQKITDVTILPLYPQYSTTTTAAIFDEVFRFYLSQEDIPTLHLIKDFAEDASYCQLIAKYITDSLKVYQPDLLLFSYHGIPVSYVTKGDPYQEQCEKTTAKIMSYCETTVNHQLVYQSKFGQAEWLTPSLETRLKELPSEGVKKVLIVTPGFVSDCVETLEEIEEENYHYFKEAGGEEFHYIHPVNGDPDFIECLAVIIENKRGK